MDQSELLEELRKKFEETKKELGFKSSFDDVKKSEETILI